MQAWQGCLAAWLRGATGLTVHCLHWRLTDVGCAPALPAQATACTRWAAATPTIHSACSTDAVLADAGGGMRRAGCGGAAEAQGAGAQIAAGAGAAA